MKKFRILLMTLMFAIFSFASPSQAEMMTFDNDVGVENIQKVTIDSIMVIDFQEVMINASIISSVKDAITDTNYIYYFEKYDPYKYMSIALSQDVLNKERQRKDKKLTYIYKIQIRYLRNLTNIKMVT